MILGKLLIPKAGTTILNGLYDHYDFENTYPDWVDQGGITGSPIFYSDSGYKKINSYALGSSYGDLWVPGTHSLWLTGDTIGLNSYPWRSTISFWLMAQPYWSTDIPIFRPSYQNSNGSIGYIDVDFSTGYLNLYFEQDALNYRRRRAYLGSMVDGTWYHLIININMTDNSYQVYRNNVSLTLTNLDYGTAAARVDRNPVANSCGLTIQEMVVDQFCVWETDRFLTATERSALYNSGNGLPYQNW